MRTRGGGKSLPRPAASAPWIVATSQTPADALAMCRRAYRQGVRHSVALAHQNEEYPANTPQRLIQTGSLKAAPYSLARISEASFVLP